MVNSYFPTLIGTDLRQHPDIERHRKPISNIYNIECVMSKADLHQRLNRASEITLSVKGRKSGRDIPRPVWFVHEGNTVFLLPNYGSDTNWYKSFLVDPTLKISVGGGGGEIPAKGKPITDSSRVNDIFGKFDSKYGGVKRYYPKVDVAVEVPL
jgi:F420H(2)-dependent quinone reductase